MDVRGFWRSAEEEPERPALVLPDGRRVSAGALRSEGNRLLEGLMASPRLREQAEEQLVFARDER